MTMESGLDALAAAVDCLEPSTRQREHARLRVADGLFAYQLGRAMPVAPLVGALAGSAPSSPPCSPAAVAYELAACIRCTEIDDLLLATCTSPGAIVIPCVVAVAGMDPSVMFEDLLDAVVVGYGVAGWLGAHSGGALAVTRGAWPSRAVAPVAAALCAGRALGLDRRALVEAATLASLWRVEGRLSEPARELSFARAVGIGVEAAQAAASGVRAGATVEPGCLSPIEGNGAEPLSRATLETAVLEARVKLFCSARQAMPALVAVNRALVSAGVSDLDALDAIELDLPAACAAMVDVPHVATRLDSLRSVQYQIAALLLSPETLFDVTRSSLRLAGEAEALAPRISVRAASDLEAAFPASWPARATVTTGGRRTTVLVEDKPPAAIGASLLRAKQRAFCGSNEAAAVLAAATLEACDAAKSAGDLWSLARLLAGGDGGGETYVRERDPWATRRR